MSYACDYDKRINYHLLSKQMLSLYGNIYTSGNTADPAVLREVVKGGNLKKEDKTKITKAIKKIEKEEEKAKMPALDLRAMYGN
jgi:hypothetical protein